MGGGPVRRPQRRVRPGGHPRRSALPATLDWLADHVRAEVVLRAVLAAVWAADGDGGRAPERVLELLWGPASPARPGARKLPMVRALVELLVVATRLLDARSALGRR